MTRLILIRHGETDANKNHTLCGWSNPPLNQTGREQARRLGKRLEKEAIDIIITSGMKRAVETATYLMEKREIPLITTEAFRELHFGDFEGMKMQEVEKQFPVLYEQLEKDFIHFQFPGGETLWGLHQRVKEKVHEIIAQYEGQTIAIISHSGVIRCILAELIVGDVRGHWKFQADHCSVTTIENKNHFSVLTKLNDVGNSLRKMEE